MTRLALAKARHRSVPESRQSATVEREFGRGIRDAGRDARRWTDLAGGGGIERDQKRAVIDDVDSLFAKQTGELTGTEDASESQPLGQLSGDRPAESLPGSKDRNVGRDVRQQLPLAEAEPEQRLKPRPVDSLEKREELAFGAPTAHRADGEKDTESGSVRRRQLLPHRTRHATSPRGI